MKKKIYVLFFIILAFSAPVFAGNNGILTTIEKDALIIDDTKMQNKTAEIKNREAKTKKIDPVKDLKKRQKEELKQQKMLQKQQLNEKKQELKEINNQKKAAKQKQVIDKNAQKLQAKENEKMRLEYIKEQKKNLKEQELSLKKQRKSLNSISIQEINENKINASAKNEVEAAKNKLIEPVENKVLEPVETNIKKISNPASTEQIENKSEKKELIESQKSDFEKNKYIENAKKEAGLLKENIIEEKNSFEKGKFSFDEKALSLKETEKMSEKREFPLKEDKNEITSTGLKTPDIEADITKTLTGNDYSNLKTPDTGADKTVQNNEILPENPLQTEEKKKSNPVHKKRANYKNIEENSTSVNEFLQFTDDQNEKFSIYYYETTSKLKDYSNKLHAKEKYIKDIKKKNGTSSPENEKLKKAEDELDNLMKERDDYYNKSLAKFNSILTKKQRTKWEVLQQMGYRFLPEAD